MRTLDRPAIASLFEELRLREYDVVGPTVRDGAIVLDEIASPGSDAPEGGRSMS